MSTLTPIAASHKQTAERFLVHAREGNRAAAEALLAPDARHHNPYFAAGMPALLDGMEQAARAAPDRVMDVKRILLDGDLVAVHSHVYRVADGNAGAAVVHLFRFEGDKIAELWDVGQPVPAEIPNQ